MICRGCHLHPGLGIDPKAEPSQQPILKLISQHDVVQKRIRPSRLQEQHVVARVSKHRLAIRAVGARGLDAHDEVLVKVQLRHVGRRRVRDGTVGVGLDAEMGHDVHVHGAAGVVTREEGVELHGAMLVRHLEATQEGLFEVGLVAQAGAVEAGDHAAVDASGVGICTLMRATVSI